MQSWLMFRNQHVCVFLSFLMQARVERMEDFKKKGEDLTKSLQESRRKLTEAQKKVQELSISAADESKAELTKAQAEEKKLKKEERDWEKKLDEFNREEKKMPWNVDTLSKEGFSKVMQANPGPGAYWFFFTPLVDVWTSIFFFLSWWFIILRGFFSIINTFYLTSIDGLNET